MTLSEKIEDCMFIIKKVRVEDLKKALKELQKKEAEFFDKGNVFLMGSILIESNLNKIREEIFGKELLDLKEEKSE